MNKLVLSAVLALSGLASYAQGVINGFNAFNPPGSSVPALVYESVYGYTPVATSIGRAEVWTIDGTMVLSPTKDGQGDPFVAQESFP